MPTKKPMKFLIQIVKVGVFWGFFLVRFRRFLFFRHPAKITPPFIRKKIYPAVEADLANGSGWFCGLGAMQELDLYLPLSLMLCQEASGKRISDVQRKSHFFLTFPPGWSTADVFKRMSCKHHRWVSPGVAKTHQGRIARWNAFASFSLTAKNSQEQQLVKLSNA